LYSLPIQGHQKKWGGKKGNRGWDDNPGHHMQSTLLVSFGRTLTYGSGMWYKKLQGKRMCGREGKKNNSREIANQRPRTPPRNGRRGKE